MPDVHDVETRSRNMRAIKGSDTKPELVIRRGLHHHGYRYLLGGRGLPGRPDVVLPKHRAAIFVHGCFWHGHSCSLFRWPASRPDFWREKIAGNVERDERATLKLQELGWDVAIVWECALKGRRKLGAKAVIDGLTAWLKQDDRAAVVYSEHADSL